MSDVFDKDLMKELGLDEDDIAMTQTPGKKIVPPENAAGVATQAPQAKSAMPQSNVSDAAKKTQFPPAPPAATVQRTAAPTHQAPSGNLAKPQSAAPQNQSAGLQDKGLPQSAVSKEENISQDLPVQLVGVLARQSVKLKDLVKLKTGEIIDFKKPVNEPIDLVANGKLVAKAELVMIEGKLGVRILHMVK